MSKFGSRVTEIASAIRGIKLSLVMSKSGSGSLPVPVPPPTPPPPVVVPVVPTDFLFGTESSGNNGLDVELYQGASSDWVVRDILTGKTLADKSGIHDPDITFITNSDTGGLTLTIPIVGVREFQITGVYDKVALCIGSLDDGSSMETRMAQRTGVGNIAARGVVPNRLIIRRFSETIVSHSFNTGDWLLTVPDELPSYVTSTDSMFCYVENVPGNISSWDVSNVTNMTMMFRGCKSFNRDISNWDVSNVTDMSSMFYECEYFNVDISSWDVSNVTNMPGMFGNASSFNQDIGPWNTSKVAYMRGMFYNCTVFNQDLSEWCVRLVSDKPEQFDENTSAWALSRPRWGLCPRNEDGLGLPPVVVLQPTGLRVDYPGTGWYMATDTGTIFCKDVTEGETGQFEVDGPEYVSVYTKEGVLSNGVLAAVSNITDMTDMFLQNRVINHEFNHWDVSNVTSMKNMFSRAKYFNRDISNWDVSNVTDMSSMFYECEYFNRDISSWDVSNVTSMRSMFYYCRVFNQDLSNWCVRDTNIAPDYFSSITPDWVLPKPTWGTCRRNEDGLGTTYEPTGLKADYPGTGWYKATDTGTVFCKGVPEGEKGIFEPDGVAYVSVYNRDDAFRFGSRAAVSNITNMRTQQLSGTNAFNSDISGWDVSNVTDMNSLFYYCTSFNQDISGWDVSNVTDMQYMFNMATSFNQDISSWDVSNVTSMFQMFLGCSNFNQDIAPWDVSNVTKMGAMFRGAGLFNQDLSGWCVQKMSAQPEYFAWSTPSWTLPRPVWGTCPPRNADGVVTLYYPTGLAADYPGTGWYKATDTGIVFCKDVPENEVGLFEEGGIEYVSVYTKEDAKLHSAAAATSNITDMHSLFINDTTFNENISSWDTSNVTTMNNMFFGATNFNQDLSKWNVSNVTDMTNMFKETSYFNSDIGNWDTSNVTTMNSMFHTCTLFNQDIGGWDTSNVTDMRAMFNKCRDFNQDIGGWNVSNVTRTGMSYMFDSASSFNQDLSGWNVSNIASLPMNFNANQSGLNDVNLPLWGTNGVKAQHAPHESFGFRNVDDNDNNLTVKMAIAKPVANWKLYASDVLIADSEGRTSPLVTFTQNEGYVFVTVNAKTTHSGYNLVTQSTYLEVILLDNGQGKLEVTDYSNTIAQCRFVANTIPLTVTASLPPNITTTALMFYGCSKFNSPLDHWNTSNVTNMQAMFSLCTSFNQDISNWDVSNVTNTTFMFNGCSKFNSPLNTWDVSKVVMATSMFKECIVFNQPLNLWNTSSLVSADFMFKLAAKFNQDLSNWNMSKVTHTESMFESATLFNGDLSTWDTSNVTNMSFMFFDNVNFNQDIGGWNVSKVTDIANMKSMFNRAVSFNQDLSAWDVSRLSREPDYFKYNNTVWVKSKPLWGQSPITNLAWSISDITVIEDAVDVNATKRTDGMNYSSAIRYTPSASEIKEGMVTNAAAPLIDHILNKLIGQVTSWSFDVDNNRITYN